MTPILSAAAQGHSAEQILRYLQNAFPKLAPKILKATASGYSTDQVLKYLNRLMEEETFSHNVTPHEIEAAHQKKYNEVGKKLLGGAATAAGVSSFIKNLPPLVRSLGSLSSQNIGPSPMSNAPGVSMASPQGVPAASQSTQESGIQPQQQQKLPANPSQISPENSIRLIEQMNIGPQIQTLHQAGNNPEAIAAAIGVSLKPHQRKWLDEQIKEGKAKSLPDLITDYVGGYGEKTNTMASQPVEEKAAESKSVRTEFPGGHYEGPNWEGTGAAQRHPGIKAGNIVATPGGSIGTIKSERNGKALVDIDGKMRQENADDLIESPISDDELAELHESLIHGIERKTGEHVSRNVEWAGYHPESNYLAYIPHDGGLYIYPNISEEDANYLTSKLTQRKSTGSNFIGAWQRGTESPIGAAMSALIKRLQGERGGKGKEYLLKFDTVYRALEPAIKAAKEAKRKKR